MLLFEKVAIRPNPEGSDHYKRWESTCGRFRVEWRNRINGIKLDPAFYKGAHKRMFQGKEMWVMIGNGRHRTLGGAKRACDDWLKRNKFALDAMLAG